MFLVTVLESQPGDSSFGCVQCSVLWCSWNYYEFLGVLGELFSCAEFSHQTNLVYWVPTEAPRLLTVVG